MKLQAIKRICAERKMIEILDTPQNRQWVGDGEAFYPVDSGIHIDEYNIASLMDLDDAAMDKIIVTHTAQDDPRFSMADAHRESGSMRPHLTVWMSGRSYCLLRDEENGETLTADVLMINTAYLQPAKTKNGHMEYFLCPAYTDRGIPLRPLVAVFNSLLCAALIFPESKERTDTILSAMRDAAYFDPVAGLDGRMHSEREDVDAESEAAEAERQAEAQMHMDDDLDTDPPDNE